MGDANYPPYRLRFRSVLSRSRRETASGVSRTAVSSIQRWIKDPFPALSHLVGALLSIAALAVLLKRTHGQPRLILGFAVYGLSLIVLYSASALTHAVRGSAELCARLDQFDYAAIFLLIAGTYTPFCLVTLRGRYGSVILTAEWTMATLGILDVAIGKGRSNWRRVGIYVTMGWLGLLAARPLIHALPPAGWAWLLAGGLFYSLGAVVFALDRPHLCPGLFHAHDLWHLMVLAGSSCHFILILHFVAPA
jgi:hemolysin III